MNAHLGKRGIKIEDVATELSDGVKLIQFFEIISNEALGKYDAGKPGVEVRPQFYPHSIFSFTYHGIDYR
jgi:hypothetical protein